MAMLRGLTECARLKGVGFVHVGSFGQEPNWFARPLPSRISEACRRAFVTALATVRKEFDLLFPQRFGAEESSPSNNNGGSRSRPFTAELGDTGLPGLSASSSSSSLSWLCWAAFNALD